MQHNNTANSKRIAKNTLLLYVRMLFLMLVSLYTSRVILDALGMEDYGIYDVVGGFVSMFALISAALTSACSRFLNFELGKGDLKRQNIVFSTAVTIQCGLAIIVAILAEVIGVWYVNNVMVIPLERLTAANWCFQFSIFNFCLNLVTVPYNASIIAHERMKAFAYVGLFQGVTKLGISIFIYFEPFDRLVFFALLLMILQFVICYIYQVYCRKNFSECHYHYIIDKPLLRHMFSYSLWHLIGNGASVLKNQGVNLLLNFFFGPVVNAARGVTNQVDQAVSQLAGNFMIAMNPQITKSYAKGEYTYMFNLVIKGARFSFFLLLILSLPIIFNADYILHIWLKEVPEYTVEFSQLTLLATMISSLSLPLITAQNATGNVRNYQIVVGGVELLNLPFCYLCLYLGMSPLVVVLVSILVNILSLGTRMYMLPRTLKGFHPRVFIHDAVLKCFEVTVAASVIPIILYLMVPKNAYSFMGSVIVCIVFSSLSVYFIGCNQSERLFILSKVRDFSLKIYQRH